MATTNTITGQLTRINSAANLIWNKASDMALQLPAGSYWDLISKSDKAITGVNLITGIDSPEAEYKIDSNGGKATYNFGIDAVAQAIWNINSRAYLEQNSSGTYISGDQDINAKTTIKIPVGYNKTEFVITAKSIGEQLNNTSAASKYLYKNKTAYIKNAAGEHELITGTLGTVYLNAALGEYNANKINTNNGTLKVSINSGATSEFLDTNIVYRNPEALVTDSTTVVQLSTYTNNSKDYVKVNLSKGYYDKNIQTDIPYIGTQYKNTVKVTRTTSGEGTTVVANSLTIPAGYYKNGLVITPVFEDFADNVESVLNITNIDLLSGNDLTIKDGKIEFSPGTYAGGPFDYFDHVAIPQAITTSADGQFTVEKAGWLNKGTFGIKYKYLTPDQITVSDDWDTTNKLITDRVFTIKVDKGYYSAADVTKEFTIKPGTHTQTAYASIFNYTDNKFGGSTAQTINVTVSKQFGKFEHTITAGWIAAQPKTTTYFQIRDWARKSTTANTANYYTVGTAGWIKANSYVGSSIYTPAATIFNPVNAASKLTIPAGAVLSNSITVNPITAGTATYKILGTDLSDTDSIITISASQDTDGDVDTYMSSVTVDMTLILQELQKI